MKLYNTLTRKIEVFKPLEDKKVKLYTCGLTVYSQPHIGNWVIYIYWDVLVRILRAEGYDVHHVQNITDVGHLTGDEDAGEDKMLKGALKEGATAWAVADKYIKIAHHEAFELLKLTNPNHMPRATDYISQQIEFVKELEAKDFTYKLPDGIYFDTSKLKDYGKLAQLNIEGLQFGARVADTGKKNPTDFAIWKFSNPEEKRDMEWQSPWGIGFPGWHLECSVMARELLGDQIDIHTGGIDHIPVHHTNEIAQTESITSQRFSNFWVHANHIKVDGTKMSKSLGNIYTLQDILDKGFSLDAFKLLVLSKHYKTEGNFTWKILEAAQNRLNNWGAVADLKWQTRPTQPYTLNDGTEQLTVALYGAAERIQLALNDDLDTPLATTLIDEIFDLLEKNQPQDEDISALNSLLETIKQLLGIDLCSEDITEIQKQAITDRETARANKDWQKSDKLRDELQKQGIVIKDTPNGTIWSRIRS